MKLLILLFITSCGSMDVNVSDSEHLIRIENFCDKETFPDPAERRACIEKLLEAL